MSRPARPEGFGSTGWSRLVQERLDVLSEFGMVLKEEAVCGVGAHGIDLLGDEAADREPEKVGPGDLQRVEEGEGLVRHLSDGCGCRSGRASDPGVVECDDVPGGRADQEIGGIYVAHRADPSPGARRLLDPGSVPGR